MTANTRDETLIEDPGRVKDVDPALPKVPHLKGIDNWQFVGQGAYGTVWSAVDESVECTFAFKFLKRKPSLHSLEAMREEAKRLHMLRDDPGIVQVFEAELEGERPYIRMSYAPGGSLEHLLGGGSNDSSALKPATGSRYARLPKAQALAIFEALVRTMAYVHTRKIIHCDLKPSNILFDDKNQPRVADFGQALLSHEVSPGLGTFFYMPPDQADSGREPDTRWDVHALGAILYAMLTGSPPRHSRELVSALKSTEHLDKCMARYRDFVCAQPLPDAHRPHCKGDPDLERIIDRCLDLDPARRFSSAGAIADALKQRTERATRRRVRERVFCVAGVLFLMAILAGHFAIKHFVDVSSGIAVDAIRKSEMVTIPVMKDRLQSDLQRELDRVTRIAGRLSARDDLIQAIQRGQPSDSLDQGLAQIAQAEDLGFLLRSSSKPAKAALPAQAGLAAAQSLEDLIIELRLVANNGRFLTLFTPENDEAERHKTFNPTNASLWSWRDWYNGLSDQSPAFNGLYPMITEPHVSDPYISRRNGQRRITISAPVFAAAAGGKPVGLVATTIRIDQFNRWLNQMQHRMKGGFIVVVNQRGHCIHHDANERSPELVHFSGEKPRVMANLANGAPYSALLSGAGADRDVRDLGSVQDPFTRKSYLAYGAKMDPPLAWGLLLQRDPVATTEEMRWLATLMWCLLFALLAIAGALGAITFAAPEIYSRWKARFGTPST